MNTENTEVDVLGVFSHPDDAELMAAGTLLKLKSLGYRTGIIDMTRGEMGTRGTVELRAEEAQEAGRILRLDVRLNLALPDGHIWPTEETRQGMVRVIRRQRPKVILTQHWDDSHPDHANTCRIVREAARLASMRRYDEPAGQRAVERVPVVAHTVHSRLIVPSFIVDVSEFVEDKMRSIRAHTSQFYHPASQEPKTRISDEKFLSQLEGLMRYYGSLIGVDAGEAFYVREAINVDDPIALLTRPMNIYS